jgi:hypothetical protein
MVEVEVVRELEHPAEAIWHFLSWRGVGNIEGDVFFERISFEDELDAVGSVRVLHLNDGSAVREVVEELDHEAMRYRYRPLTLGSLPVENYTGEVHVRALGADRCRVTIRSRCDVVGVSAAQWRATYSAMENALIDLIAGNAARLSGGSP